MKNLRSQTSLLTLFITALFMIPGTLHGESIFLKDGSIVEGKIVTNTTLSIVVKTIQGEKKVKSRSIIRIRQDEEYKEKKFIYMKDGTLVTGYIVAKNDSSLFIRTKLTSPVETKISRKKIKAVSTKTLSEFTQPPVIINGKKSIFRNLLGVRYIIGAGIRPTITVSPIDPVIHGHLIPAGIGLFYYDKYIDIDFEFFPKIAGTRGQSFLMGFLPFSGLGLGLGFSIGYMEYTIDGSTTSPFIYFNQPTLGNPNIPYLFNMTVSGMYVGLYYRLANLMRVGGGYLLDFNSGFNLYDTDFTNIYSYSSSLNGDAVPLNIYLFAEFWVDHHISLKISWLFLQKHGTNGTAVGLSTTQTIWSQMVFLSISYAFNLGDK